MSDRRVTLCINIGKHQIIRKVSNDMYDYREGVSICQTGE